MYCDKINYWCIKINLQKKILEKHTLIAMEWDHLNSKNHKNKGQSLKLVPIHSVISTIRPSNPEPKTTRGRRSVDLWHWGKKAG